VAVSAVTFPRKGSSFRQMNAARPPNRDFVFGVVRQLFEPPLGRGIGARAGRSAASGCRRGGRLARARRRTPPPGTPSPGVDLSFRDPPRPLRPPPGSGVGIRPRRPRALRRGPARAEMRHGDVGQRRHIAQVGAGGRGQPHHRLAGGGFAGDPAQQLVPDLLGVPVSRVRPAGDELTDGRDCSYLDPRGVQRNTATACLGLLWETATSSFTGALSVMSFVPPIGVFSSFRLGLRVRARPPRRHRHQHGLHDPQDDDQCGQTQPDRTW
jgi:hypothetical protein